MGNIPADITQIINLVIDAPRAPTFGHGIFKIGWAVGFKLGLDLAGLALDFHGWIFIKLVRDIDVDAQTSGLHEYIQIS